MDGQVDGEGVYVHMQTALACRRIQTKGLAAGRWLNQQPRIQALLLSCTKAKHMYAWLGHIGCLLMKTVHAKGIKLKAGLMKTTS